MKPSLLSIRNGVSDRKTACIVQFSLILLLSACGSGTDSNGTTNTSSVNNTSTYSSESAGDTHVQINNESQETLTQAHPDSKILGNNAEQPSAPEQPAPVANPFAALPVEQPKADTKENNNTFSTTTINTSNTQVASISTENTEFNNTKAITSNNVITSTSTENTSSTSSPEIAEVTPKTFKSLIQSIIDSTSDTSDTSDTSSEESPAKATNDNTVTDGSTGTTSQALTGAGSDEKDNRIEAETNPVDSNELAESDINLNESNEQPEPDIELTEANEQSESGIELAEANEQSEPDIELTEANEQSEPDIELTESNEQSESGIELTESNEQSEPDIELTESNEQSEFSGDTEATNQSEPEDQTSEYQTNFDSRSVDTYESEPVETQFFSHTTPGFEGEVLDDSIRVTWDAHPDARGYNVYRQAKYITTVMTNEYIDVDVYDRDYYYEIQAFNYSDDLYYIATGLTVKARSFGRKDPDAPLIDMSFLDDYQLVFSEEFDSTVLDTSKWNTAYLWGPDLTINSEEQYYVDIANDPDFGFNPFTFDGEHMTINSIRTPPELASKARNKPYLSGVITSYDSFKFTYGYAEARAKMTHGRGYWPAFWLLNAYYVDDKPEIDIMEFIANDQDVVYATYHYYDSEGKLRSTHSKPTPGIDFTNDFHTFAVDWRPNTLVFYVDNIEVHRITDTKVSRQEMYIIANTAIGGWWPGSPNESTPFPGEYIIDYIRVYQKQTPFNDDVLFNDGISELPLAEDLYNNRSSSHRPSLEQWSEGYPDGL